jgi:hypothetical protein
MGPRMMPVYRRRPLWGWYPIHGPYMWGVGCLLPIIGAAAFFVLAVLRSIF